MRNSNSGNIILPLPPAAPRVKSNCFTRWLGRCVLRLGGWRMIGTFPDRPKLVVILAPHSSNWDAVIGLAAKMALGVDICVLGKSQLFWWPLGAALRRLGVVPVDRQRAHGVVDQAVQLIQHSERCWFVLAPEGTRKRVERWKSGFWKIAHTAGVPILPAYLHYPQKRIGIGPMFIPGEDMQADMQALREWYRPWIGKHRDTL